MSAVLPDPLATSYRDPKKPLWLLPALIPAIVATGPVAHLTGQDHAAWYVLPFLVLFMLVPILDWLIGDDTSNPPEAAVPDLERRAFYRWMIYLAIPVGWATTLFNVWFLSTHAVPWYGVVTTVIINGFMLGLVMNMSHELGHKKEWLPRKAALFNLSLGAYTHFCIEHNRGHHRHVATPEDPASSKMGETIYRFMFREMPGAYFRGWDLEVERLERQGKSAWSLDNEIVQGWIGTAIVWGGMTAWLGTQALVLLMVLAFLGAFMLTSANYIEHYGLVRQKKADGRYEHCQPHHSWNSNHVLSNILTFQLQRHSDHHANPTRSYQSLRSFHDIPTFLPLGYTGMFLVAYVPWLWFAVMDKRVVKATGGDASRINFLPAQRKRLVKAFGMKDEAGASA